MSRGSPSHSSVRARPTLTHARVRGAHGLGAAGAGRRLRPSSRSRPRSHGDTRGVSAAARRGSGLGPRPVPVPELLGGGGRWPAGRTHARTLHHFGRHSGPPTPGPALALSAHGALSALACEGVPCSRSLSVLSQASWTGAEPLVLPAFYRD